MVKRTPVTGEVYIPPPAKTLEGRNDQLIEAAFNLAEKRIYNETASAQEVVHFLKQGSVRDRLEIEKIKNENLVLQTRVKEMESRKTSEEVAAKALAAIRGYMGLDDVQQDPSEIENMQF